MSRFEFGARRRTSHRRRGDFDVRARCGAASGAPTYVAYGPDLVRGQGPYLRGSRSGPTPWSRGRQAFC